MSAKPAWWRSWPQSARRAAGEHRGATPPVRSSSAAARPARAPPPSPRLSPLYAPPPRRVPTVLQLAQRARAGERADEDAVGPEHSADLAQRAGEVVDPVQAAGAQDGVEARVVERQRPLLVGDDRGRREARRRCARRARRDGLRRGVALRERHNSARDVTVNRICLERRAEMPRPTAEVQRVYFLFARCDVAQAPDDAHRRRLAQVRNGRRVLGGGARAMAQLQLAVEDGRLA